MVLGVSGSGVLERFRVWALGFFWVLGSLGYILLASMF